MGKWWDPGFGRAYHLGARVCFGLGHGVFFATGFWQEGFNWARVHTSVKANPLLLLFIIRDYQNWAERGAGIGQYVHMPGLRKRHRHHMESKQCYCASKSLLSSITALLIRCKRSSNLSRVFCSHSHTSILPLHWGH